MQITVQRDGTTHVLTATPTLSEEKDFLGNVHRIGLLGIKRSTAIGDLKFQPVSAPEAVWLGTQQTWVVVDSDA